MPLTCSSGTSSGTFYVPLGTNGHQKEAILALLAADCNHGILNGYAPEYVKARHIAEYVCWTIYNSRNYYGIIATYFMQIYVKYSKLKRCMSIFFRFLTHLTIEYIFDF